MSTCAVFFCRIDFQINGMTTTRKALGIIVRFLHILPKSWKKAREGKCVCEKGKIESGIEKTVGSCVCYILCYKQGDTKRRRRWWWWRRFSFSTGLLPRKHQIYVALCICMHYTRDCPQGILNTLSYRENPNSCYLYHSLYIRICSLQSGREKNSCS